MPDKILHLSDFCHEKLSQKSSEPRAEIFQQSQFLASGGPRFLYFVSEAATDEVEQNFMSVFVNFAQVVTNTRKYLKQLSSLLELCEPYNQQPWVGILIFIFGEKEGFFCFAYISLGGNFLLGNNNFLDC